MQDRPQAGQRCGRHAPCLWESPILVNLKKMDALIYEVTRWSPLQKLRVKLAGAGTTPSGHHMGVQTVKCDALI